MSGQGQYILLSENYGMVRAMNGSPDTIGIHPSRYLVYADYELSLGVVFAIRDLDSSDTPGDNEPIDHIIVNDNEDSDSTNDYKGMTTDSIGIGSSILDVLDVYKYPTGLEADTVSQPFYWRYEWATSGLTCYTDYAEYVADRFIHEIHLANMTPPLLSSTQIGRMSVSYQNR